MHLGEVHAASNSALLAEQRSSDDFASITAYSGGATAAAAASSTPSTATASIFASRAVAAFVELNLADGGQSFLTNAFNVPPLFK